MIDDRRLLHRNSVYGYTASPAQALGHSSGFVDTFAPHEAPSVKLVVDDAGEAVSEEEQHRLSTKAHARFADMRAEQQMREALRTANSRLRRAVAQASKSGVDAVPFVLKIESEIRALEDQLNRPNPEAA